MARFLPSFSERVQQSLDQDEQRQNNEHDEQNNYIEEDSMIEEVPALDASTSDSSESTPSDENSLDSENSFLVLPEHRLEMGLTPPYAQKGFDRFISNIPSSYSRVAYLSAPPSHSGTRVRAGPRPKLIALNSDAVKDKARKTYSKILFNEFYPDASRQDSEFTPPVASSSKLSPDEPPTKRRRILDFPQLSHSRQTSAVPNGLDSPVHAEYVSSPLQSTSQTALLHPVKNVRIVSKAPYKVLDAPDITDDFYLNLVDWSSTNLMGVALRSCVYLWAAESSEVTKLCDVNADNDTITSLQWAQEGSMLAIGTGKGKVHLWDVEAQKRIRTMEGHARRVGSISWSRSTVASGSRDRSILLRDARCKNESQAKIEAHRQECCGLKFNPLQHDLLASGGNDNKLFVWDIRHLSRDRSGQSHPLHKFNEHTAAIKALAWSPHASGILASGGGTLDRRLRFWNTGTGKKINEFDTGSQICNLAWSLNTNELVSTHGYSTTPIHNQVCIWRYPSLDQVATLEGHSRRVLYLAVSPDGRSIATGAGDETLRFWYAFPDREGNAFSRPVDDVIGKIR